MSDDVRWNLVVSRGTDNSLRRFLGSQGRGRKGKLSRFVEDAVRTRIFELEVEQAKAENSGLSAATIEDAIEEALSATAMTRGDVAAMPGGASARLPSDY